MIKPIIYLLNRHRVVQLTSIMIMLSVVGAVPCSADFGNDPCYDFVIRMGNIAVRFNGETRDNVTACEVVKLENGSTVENNKFKELFTEDLIKIVVEEPLNNLLIFDNYSKLIIWNNLTWNEKPFFHINFWNQFNTSVAEPDCCAVNIQNINGTYIIEEIVNKSQYDIIPGLEEECNTNIHSPVQIAVNLTVLLFGERIEELWYVEKVDYGYYQNTDYPWGMNENTTDSVPIYGVFFCLFVSGVFVLRKRLKRY